jgi:type II secretory ATPase GspE/PulE/Tfp pilus assembly ATPase PilB-like protein
MSKTITAPTVEVSDMPIEKAVAKLIEHAASTGASDLFLISEPGALSAQIRHLGHVKKISRVPLEVGRKFISHIRACAGMNVSEKRRPVDGRWVYLAENGNVIDLRINTIPTIHGEDLAIRLLVRESHLLTLENLGLIPDQYSALAHLLDTPSGLVLMTGPTGSGKTATLYACLMKLNDGRRKINTIEDPIEYSLEGLRQSQVNPAIDLGFAELFRSVLRQSPDVIMLGEIRDPETADTAVRAANSGHLVMATVHAPTAAGAIQSMRALGINTHFLSTALRGVVSQRLVRTLCPKCKVSFDLSAAPNTFEEVRPWLAAGEGAELFASPGCEHCDGSGYAARTGIFEVMPITQALRELISEGHSTADIRARAVAEEMLEFRHVGLIKIAQGQTSIEEILRVVPTEHLALEEEAPRLEPRRRKIKAPKMAVAAAKSGSGTLVGPKASAAGAGNDD